MTNALSKYIKGNARAQTSNCTVSLYNESEDYTWIFPKGLNKFSYMTFSDTLKASIRGSGIFWICLGASNGAESNRKRVSESLRNLIVGVVTSARMSLTPIPTKDSHSKTRTVEVDGRLTHGQIKCDANKFKVKSLNLGTACTPPGHNDTCISSQFFQ